MNKLFLSLLALLCSVTIFAQTDLIISEYVEGWSNNKAIEVYNPTSASINLKNYRLTRYSNGSDVPPASSNWYIVLPDVELKPFRTYVCVIDKRDPNGVDQEAPVWEQLADRADVFLCPDYDVSKALYHNGDDAIALEKTDGTLVDLFARWGAPRPGEAAMPGSTSLVRCWTNTSPFFTGVGIGITADHTLTRKSNIVAGVTANPSMFNPLAEWDSLPANTFNNLGWHKFDNAPANSTPAFAKDSFEFFVWKESPAATVLGKLEATDAEGDALRYFINKGNYVYNSEDVRKEPFKINRETGEISVSDPSAMLESTWDTLFMSVSVNDGTSETAWITAKVILSDTPVSSKYLKSGDLKILPVAGVDNAFSIKSSDAISNITVFSIDGRKVYSENINSGLKNHIVNLQGVKSGMYILSVSYCDNKLGSSKISVK